MGVRDGAKHPSDGDFPKEPLRDMPEALSSAYRNFFFGVFQVKNYPRIILLWDREEWEIYSSTQLRDVSPVQNVRARRSHHNNG
jgi:hypothetical protein